MLLTPLLTAAIETALNQLLFKDRSMKAARLRLAGKVLRIDLQELSSPLTLIFSEQKIDVVGQWDGEADCTLNTRLVVLRKLRDRQQLAPLIRSGELVVDGDIQVVQQFAALLDMSEWEPAELLAPYIGDIAAQSLSQAFTGGFRFLTSGVKKHQDQLAQALTEEWKLAPGTLETAWFADEVSALERQINALEARLLKLGETP
ncbi:MAG: SCP2 domain-containing protein [Rouxiella aceris]|uniref:ubiquinone biosynthesis protein UbiJ n=1 Tax=Rouxiella aceris TaxID=2703884 RepID=UPI00283C290C|nr:SCP2 domain-containing protein [Rouxiella aceris]MDR3433385.1 SCP2 domain-containing protein [Rouxiella aceris]